MLGLMMFDERKFIQKTFRKKLLLVILEMLYFFPKNEVDISITKARIILNA